MTSTTNMLNDLYAEIAKSLNISKTMEDKAIRAYQSVGNCIGSSPEHDVEIYPQGSFALGTVVRPLSGEDNDYDIDLVSRIKGMDAEPPKCVKAFVGNQLKSDNTYRQKLDPEGKRCWTLQFDDFHMDVLPCTNVWGSADTKSTAIRLTNKNDDGGYENRYSNPHEYCKWFESQMGEVFVRAKRRKAQEIQGSIETVKTYQVRTPLQMAIQILKHHRNVMFNGKDDAPISIIITTLAADAYAGSNGIEGVFDTVDYVLEHMEEHIIRIGQEYVIPNPTNKDENFAEKWNEDPNKAMAFFMWRNRAQIDLVKSPRNQSGIYAIGGSLMKALGEPMTKRALDAYGERLTQARNHDNLYAGIDGISIGATVGANKVPKHQFFGSTN